MPGPPAGCFYCPDARRHVAVQRERSRLATLFRVVILLDAARTDSRKGLCQLAQGPGTDVLCTERQNAEQFEKHVFFYDECRMRHSLPRRLYKRARGDQRTRGDQRIRPNQRTRPWILNKSRSGPSTGTSAYLGFSLRRMSPRRVFWIRLTRSSSPRVTT